MCYSAFPIFGSPCKGTVRLPFSLGRARGARSEKAMGAARLVRAGRAVVRVEQGGRAVFREGRSNASRMPRWLGLPPHATDEIEVSYSTLALPEVEHNSVWQNKRRQCFEYSLCLQNQGK